MVYFGIRLTRIERQHFAAWWVAQNKKSKEKRTSDLKEIRQFIAPPVPRPRSPVLLRNALDREDNDENPDWQSDTATERQLDYIANLGGTPRKGMTKGEASEYIDALRGKNPRSAETPTPRQMMVLRFWDKLDYKTKSKDRISGWLDEWYESDPDRLKAWELFKHEHNDPQKPEAVKIGIGQEYLKRIKSSGG